MLLLLQEKKKSVRKKKTRADIRREKSGRKRQAEPLVPVTVITLDDYGEFAVQICGVVCIDHAWVCHPGGHYWDY